MDWLWWIIVGLLAGIFAKSLMAGDRREPKGCLYTMLLGIAGSLIVGAVMRTFFHSSGLGGFIPTIFGATLGAMFLIWLFRKLWRD